ncbi:alpha-E domain-containing protein [bacterium]|nr:alpha-E domain-containing protein [bacterium]
MLSRVADSLYWMSRYLERAEHTARTLDVHLTLMLDQFHESAPRRWHRLLATLSIDDSPEATEFDAQAVTHLLTVDNSNMASILSCVASARENARQIRDSISSEMFEQINRLYHHVKSTSFESIKTHGHSDFTSRIVEGSALFQGVTGSTIARGEGYQFIQIGKHLERSLMTIAMLKAYSEFYLSADGADEADSHVGHLDLVALLRCSSAFEAYCRVHTATLRKTNILEFLLLDRDFPHSVAFSVNNLFAALHSVGREGRGLDTGRTDRMIGRLQAQLTYANIEEVMDRGVIEFLDEVTSQLEGIHGGIQDIFIAYAIESELGA